MSSVGQKFFFGDLQIRVADDVYYPDVLVRCSAERGDPYCKTDPVMVAEVLSPGTQHYDRGCSSTLREWYE